MSTLRVNNVAEAGGAPVITSGVLDSGSLPAGSILQVVSVTKTDTFSASVAANAEVDVTGLNVTITPSSASNKILVSYQVHHSQQTNYARTATILYRDSTSIAIGNAALSQKRATTYAGSYANEQNDQGLAVMTFLDSPATTSAVTYKVRLYNASSGTANVHLNRSDTDSNSGNVARTVSTITVMEVAG